MKAKHYSNTKNNKAGRKVSPERRFLGLALLLTLIVDFLVYPLAVKLGSDWHIKVADTYVNKAQQALNIVRQNYFADAKHIANLGGLNEYIQRQDKDNLLYMIDRFKGQISARSIVVTNQNGLILARTPDISNIGYYVFQTSAWGREVAKGVGFHTISEGNQSPLVAVGAMPLFDANKNFTGAVITGSSFDDILAKEIKNNFLHDGREIFFYSNKNGPLGSSFTNPEAKKTILSYFNQGFDWQKNNPNNKLFKIGSTVYLAKHVQFLDEYTDGSQLGGMLVFLPYHNNYEILFSAFLSILFFLALMFYLHRRYCPQSKKHYKRFYVVIFFGLLLILLLTHTAYFYFKNKVTNIDANPYIIYNSVLRFSPEQRIIDLSSQIPVKIMIDTGGEAVNAVEVKIKFDAEIVAVKDIITIGSICGADYFLDKTIDNVLGELHISCIQPSPGFRGNDGLVAEILLEPKKIGNFSLLFDESSQVLASDGLGTDVLRKYDNASFLVASEGGDEQSEIIEVYSPSHPNSERWYKEKMTFLFWSVEAEQYIYALNQQADYQLSLDKDTVTQNNQLSKIFNKDGIYYFWIAPLVDGEVGLSSRYEIRIDSTAPSQPSIKASENIIASGEVVRLEFDSQDQGSGLQKNYYINIDESISLPTLPQLYVPLFERGRHTIKVRVFDKADNYSDNQIEIFVR